MTLTPSRTKRWRRVEYERLVDVGIFPPGEPVELLGGDLIVAEPQGIRHVTAVRRASRALEAAFGRGWEVRPQAPFALEVYREPVADPASPFGWGSARVAPLAAPTAFIPVAALLA